ncbi:type II toxin-antitoxin system RelB/DinJ family antitoxin [Actinotignum sanguinis]|uniref:Type II toxin-antitoxin system RelB/DinJ family antitoxin n=2 Tax=Actinomycetaceae TaxID=2049 RepID=A0ABZ0RB29_9ACTO|nr:type II toxin-antitoxin system RelB/DinJ family antitoxin [Actinotignum sanguinis]WPJ88699.1 type II toxin-antitoxin system RelB/DinJ family antitoxin [Schaalia turicensis]MDE1553188.1 type II toxin-antitoxin system RelB/DinJ family antitoxin [Actinotignum sanguinis]MDE1566403.1 type II toxin-antitoxin system RelB/DinJ family antitoxin [Actinotignum sanguinis]MDE1576935.1 type II toxin-antitoxin system RelB/DinJ family antitoxin [Actinotignum sanguinis]MDE1641978.1 type II toxin-antitoxin s
MAASTSTRINFRTDARTKQEAERLFDELGIDMSTALNMFLKQAVREQALPIRPALSYIPNETTRRAIAHAEEIMKGNIPEDGAVFDDTEEAIKFLDSLV